MTTYKFTRCFAFLFAATLLLFVTPGTAGAQQVVTDTTGEGAIYQFWVPDNWNNELVVWVHGITDPAEPVGLMPDTPANQWFRDFRAGLLTRGYAFAYSSFSENGYAVKDGAQRTHQLRGLFVSKFGRPIRTFLYGRSLGAAVVVELVEKYASQYDGAVCACGLIGGGLKEVEYLTNGRILYDLFFSSGVFGYFPYRLPGDAGHPVTLDFSAGSPAFNGVLGNFIAGGALTIQYAATAGIPFNLANPMEAVLGAMNVVGFYVRYAEDTLSRTHDRLPFDNTATVYHNPLYPPLDPVINAYVARYASSPDAVNYIDKYYTPTGMLNVPVYTIHTSRDPVVPLWHEGLYAGSVAAAGRSQLLVQKTINRWGHCTFTVQEQLNAFDALINWVATGVPPTP